MINNQYHQPTEHSVELLNSKGHVIAECLVKSGYLSPKGATDLSQSCTAFRRGVYETDVEKIKIPVGFINLVGQETQVLIDRHTTVRDAVATFKKYSGINDGRKLLLRHTSLNSYSVDPDEDSIAKLKMFDITRRSLPWYKSCLAVYAVFVSKKT